MKIGINPGHTVSHQPGCGAVGYIDESVETREVSRRLMALFRNAGHTVVDCTNDYASSTNENLNKIVSLANAQPLDLFVSVHFNSGGGHGVEVFTYGGKSFAEAVNICRALNNLGYTNRGIKDGSNLAVVRRTNARAMLVEVCFVDSKSDTDLYRKLGADAIAQAIYKAITGADLVVPSTNPYDVFLDKLYTKGLITDKVLWGDYTAPITKAQTVALLDNITGGLWPSDEADRSVHGCQPSVISLCGKGYITDKSQWLTNPDAPISKALLMALIDKATGGMKEKYVNRLVTHWGRNVLDSLCDKGIIETPEAWEDFEGQADRGQTMALMCKAFNV